MNLFVFFLLMLLVFSLVTFFIVKLIVNLQLKKLRRNYNAEENKSRKPESGAAIQPRREYPKLPTIADKEFGKPIASVPGNAEPQRRELLQNEPIVSVGKNEQEPGRHKRIIGRIRRRRTS